MRAGQGQTRAPTPPREAVGRGGVRDAPTLRALLVMAYRVAESGDYFGAGSPVLRPGAPAPPSPPFLLMPLLTPPRPSARRALARAASALALLALTAGAALAQPTVTLTAVPSEISENGGTSRFTATLSETIDEEVRVSLQINSGASTASGSDFVGLSPDFLLITIPPNTLSAFNEVTAADDNASEGDEQFVVSIDQIESGNATEQGNQVAVLTILDDDDATTVTLAAAPTTIDEDGGTSTITATLGEATNADVTVTLETDGDADGSALTSTTITIPRGETTGTTTLTATNDDDEANESVTVSIDGVTGGNVTAGSESSVTVTITDDDGDGTGPTNPTVTLTVDDDEIDEAGGVATVTATLSQATDEAVEVDLTPRAGFTTDAGDLTFSPSDLTIVIPQGETVGTLTATANPDDDTDDETVTLDVTAVRGGGATEATPQSVTITVNDDDDGGATDDPVVRLSVSDDDITEGESTLITVSLSDGATADGNVSVNLAYAGGASEFEAPSSVTIPSGENSASVTFTALDDEVEEANETVTVSISGVTGNASEDAEQSEAITIRDNDGVAVDEATVSFVVSEATVDEDAGTYRLRIEASQALGSDAPLTVTLTEGSSADLGGFTSRTVTLPAGDRTVTVSIPITDDEIVEGDETFTFRLSSTDNRVTIGRGTATLTVTDNDAGSGEVTDVTITEYDSVVGDDGDAFVELRAGGEGEVGDLSLVYLAADSTVIEVDDLEGLETDDDGFLVVSDDSDDSDDGGRVAALVPDAFYGVAVVRGDAPAVGTRFDFDDEDVVDVLFVDEVAAARQRGLDPEAGSIQRRADGRPAFVAPPTPGAPNQEGTPVSNEPDGPAAELVGDVFPNPSTGRAALELTVASAQTVRVSVYDALGRQVAVAYDGEARPGAAVRVSLSGSALAPGVYIVRVAGETFVESRRLTVTR